MLLPPKRVERQYATLSSNNFSQEDKLLEKETGLGKNKLADSVYIWRDSYYVYSRDEMYTLAKKVGIMK